VGSVLVQVVEADNIFGPSWRQKKLCCHLRK